MVRVHASEVTGDSKLTVGLVSVLPSSEDPSPFMDGESPVAFVEIDATLDTSEEPRPLLRKSFEPNAGGMLIPDNVGTPTLDTSARRSAPRSR
jgi:hypothetical protein